MRELVLVLALLVLPLAGVPMQALVTGPSPSTCGPSGACCCPAEAAFGATGSCCVEKQAGPRILPLCSCGEHPGRAHVEWRCEDLAAVPTPPCFASVRESTLEIRALARPASPSTWPDPQPPRGGQDPA